MARGVENDIGTELNPVAQEDHRRHVVTAVEAGDVQVPIDERLDVAVGGIVLAGEVHQAAGGVLRDGEQRLGRAARAVVVGPA